MSKGNGEERKWEKVCQKSVLLSSSLIEPVQRLAQRDQFVIREIAILTWPVRDWRISALCHLFSFLTPTSCSEQQPTTTAKESKTFCYNLWRKTVWNTLLVTLFDFSKQQAKTHDENAFLSGLCYWNGRCHGFSLDFQTSSFASHSSLFSSQVGNQISLFRDKGGR